MRNNAEERKVTGNDGSKVGKETRAMLDVSFIMEALRKRILLLVGLTVGYIFLFLLLAPEGEMLERIGAAILTAIMTYVPFRISFAITVGLFSRIAVGFLILCVIAFLTEGHPMILGLILFGGVVLDFAAAIFFEQ